MTGQPVYDDAFFGAFYNPALRRAKGTPHIDTVKSLLDGALDAVSNGDYDTAIADVESAGKQAAWLARKLKTTASRMRDALELQREGGPAGE